MSLPESGIRIWLTFHLCSLRSLLLIHGFGVEQEETEITEKQIWHCLNRVFAFAWPSISVPSVPSC